MALFQRAVLNKYLSGIDENHGKQFLRKEAEWMEYFNQQKARTDALKSQIAQTDSEIDAMVYELYGLTKEEIRVVEGILYGSSSKNIICE